MKKLMIILILFLMPITAQAGTLVVTASGFTNLPASAPVGWPTNVVWPGSQSPNGSKTYTISDADWIRVLTWTAASQSANLPAPVAGVITASAGQILLAWLQVWVNGTINAVVQYFTVPATPPPPPVIQ